jgi:hypothetical protein
MSSSNQSGRFLHGPDDIIRLSGRFYFGPASLFGFGQFVLAGRILYLDYVYPVPRNQDTIEAGRAGHADPDTSATTPERYDLGFVRVALVRAHAGSVNNRV